MLDCGTNGGGNERVGVGEEVTEAGPDALEVESTGTNGEVDDFPAPASAVVSGVGGGGGSSRGGGGGGGSWVGISGVRTGSSGGGGGDGSSFCAPVRFH